MVRATHRGRPGTPVIPPDWQERHAPIANKTMTAICQIRDPDQRGDFDPDTGTYASTPGALLYDGRCRIQRRGTDQADRQVGEQSMPVGGYLVSIEFGANLITAGTLLTVTQSTDPELTGQTLGVTSVTLGTLRWQRDLFCADDASI